MSDIESRAMTGAGLAPHGAGGREKSSGDAGAGPFPVAMDAKRSLRVGAVRK